MSGDKLGNFEIQGLMSNYEASATAPNNLTHLGDAAHGDLVGAIQSAIDNEGQDLQNQDKLGNFEIQTLTSDYNEAEQLASSIAKQASDTTNSIIGNIDGGGGGGHGKGAGDGSAHANDSFVGVLLDNASADSHGDAADTKAGANAVAEGVAAAAAACAQVPPIGSIIGAVIAAVDGVIHVIGALGGGHSAFWDQAADAANQALTGDHGSTPWHFPPLHLESAPIQPHNSGEPISLEGIGPNAGHDIVSATLQALDHDPHPAIPVIELAELHTDHLNFHV